MRNQKRYALIVVLGTAGDKMYALKAASIPMPEIIQIRKNLKKISAMPLEERIQWVKANCQTSYRSAFRTYQASKTTQVYSYDIGVLVDEVKNIKNAAT